MELIRIPSMEDGVAPLLDRLNEELTADKKVVWMLTGGSNIALCAAVMRDIPDDLSGNLTVFLTDERYGAVNHPDSNDYQLAQAGFEPKNAQWIKVLQDGLSLEETSERYALDIGAACKAADIVIAQIGMGPDGHVCGILPGSPAVESDRLVTSYESAPYIRITTTPRYLTRYVDAAYVFAFGEAKRDTLDNLRKDLPLSQQPAQVLKQLPEAYVYNDLMEGEV